MDIDFKIYQGDTGPILKPRPSVIDTGDVIDATWHCYLGVNDADGVEVIARTEITDKTADDMRWICALTPAQTATIPPLLDTPYNMVIEVTNTTTTPPFNIEKHYGLEVRDQGLTP